MIASPVRHDRVWLDPATWRDGLRSDPGEAGGAAIDDWVRCGRALVTRRRDAGIGPDACCLGVALPLALDRRRIAIVVDRAAVTRVAKPLALDAVVDAAPLRRQPALRDLHRRALDVGTPLFVYGSFAWQAISGAPCVTATSDLDLLWDAGDGEAVDGEAVERTIAMLLAWERDSGLRADGEVRFADGGAVAWRELTTGASKVLVKTDAGVALRPVGTLR